jgi:hypothetical protein
MFNSTLVADRPAVNRQNPARGLLAARAALSPLPATLRQSFKNDAPSAITRAA